MKSLKTLALLALVTFGLNSCLSLKFAEQVSAKDEYPGEFFEQDTFNVIVKNLDDQKTTIRVVDKTTKEESLKVDIGPTSQVEILVQANDLILISKGAMVEYKFELTGE